MNRNEIVRNSSGEEVEVCTDRETVWVNGNDGGCIGRFSRMGVDVHKTATDQIRDGNECIDCFRAPDWKRFTEGMSLHHGMKLDKSWCPFWAWQFEIGEVFSEGQKTTISVVSVSEDSVHLKISTSCTFHDEGSFDRFRRSGFMKHWKLIFSPVRQDVGIGETHATERIQTP